MPEPLPPPAEATVAHGSQFEGLVILRGAGRIDGQVRGNVMASGLVWIGETAEIEGEIEAEEVVVAGAVRGLVRAQRRIELLASARVEASLEAPQLRLAEGCFLEGDCRSGPEAGQAAAGTGQEPPSP